MPFGKESYSNPALQYYNLEDRDHYCI